MIRTLHGVGVWWRIQWIQMVQRSNISQNTFTAAGVERGKSSPVLQTEHLSWHVDQHFLCQLYSYTFQTLKKWSNMKTIHRNTSDILSSTKLRELNTEPTGTADRPCWRQNRHFRRHRIRTKHTHTHCSSLTDTWTHTLSVTSAPHQQVWTHLPRARRRFYARFWTPGCGSCSGSAAERGTTRTRQRLKSAFCSFTLNSQSDLSWNTDDIWVSPAELLTKWLPRVLS